MTDMTRAVFVAEIASRASKVRVPGQPSIDYGEDQLGEVSNCNTYAIDLPNGPSAGS